MGGKTNTTTQIQSLPPNVQEAYNSLLNIGSTIAKQPLQQYGGPQVAGFTPDQQQAFQLTQRAQGMGVPYLNSASNYLSQSAAPVFPTVQKYNSQTLANYQNPWQQSVIDATMAEMAHQDAMQQNELKGHSIGAGSSPFLGDRAGVAAAELARGQGANRASTLANLYSSGFMNAQQQLNQQQQLQLAGGNADSARAAAAASGMSGLGQLAQGMTLQGAQALLGTGALQQENAQQQLNVPLQQFQQQQQYPYNQANFLANLIFGLGNQGGTTSTTAPGPSPISQIAGLLTAGAGMFGLKRGGSAGHAGHAGHGSHDDNGGHGGQVGHDSNGHGHGLGFDLHGWLNEHLHSVPPALPTPPAPPATLPTLPTAPPLVPAAPPMGPMGPMGSDPGAGGYPQLNPTDFSYAPADMWHEQYYPLPNGSAASHPSYISAPPALRLSDMPQPTTYRMPSSVQAAFDAFPTMKAEGGSVGRHGLGGVRAFGRAALGGGQRTLGPISSRLNNPLVYAGLGMMAGDSPFALTNIGAGAIAGLDKYNAANPDKLDPDPMILKDGPTLRILHMNADGTIREVTDTGITNFDYKPEKPDVPKAPDTQQVWDGTKNVLMGFNPETNAYDIMMGEASHPPSDTTMKPPDTKVIWDGTKNVLMGFNPATQKYDIPMGDAEHSVSDTTEKPPETKTLWDSATKTNRVFGYNPETRKYDIDYGEAEMSPTLLKPENDDAFQGLSITSQTYNKLIRGSTDPAYRATPEYALAYKEAKEPKLVSGGVDDSGNQITVPIIPELPPNILPPIFAGQPQADATSPVSTAAAPSAEGTIAPPVVAGGSTAGAPIVTGKAQPSEGQANAALYADRMRAANKTIAELGSAGLDLGDTALSGVPLFGNGLISDEYRQFDQAKRNFINADLRRESGASISSGEFDTANRQYFPQPFDDPKTLALKAANRADAINGISHAAGPTYKPKFNLPTAAVDLLKLDPSPEAKAEFDDAFGTGAADSVLGAP